MSTKKKTRLALAAVVLVATGVSGFVVVGPLRSKSFAGDATIPTVRVQRGSPELKAYTTGELRPVRSVMLVAPPVGGTLQIVKLLKTGTRVAAGDVVIEFDPAEQEYLLEQNRSELEQAEQEIVKMKADAEVQVAQDQVALLKAKFDVRRAELEVLRSELVGAIDAKKNDLSLEEARRQLAQLEKDIPSRAASNQASLAVLEEKRNKAQLAMKQARKNIENMTVRSTLEGVLSVKENQDASGGFFFPGMQLPEFREGDLVFPGRFVAEILEDRQMEILAKVAESDRSNVNAGQTVEVRMDAVPGQIFRGRVKNVAGMASRNFWGGDPMRRFDATFQIESASDNSGRSQTVRLPLRTGITAQVIILGQPLRNALYLPSQALFERDNQPIVYVKSGRGFQARAVTVKQRTESFVVVEGLDEGTEVALVNPEGKSKRPARSGGPVLSGGGR